MVRPKVRKGDGATMLGLLLALPRFSDERRPAEHADKRSPEIDFRDA
jgi:hypothetical protein